MIIEKKTWSDMFEKLFPSRKNRLSVFVKFKVKD